MAINQIAAQLDRTPAHHHTYHADPHYQFILDAQRTFAPLDLPVPAKPTESFKQHTRQWTMLQWMRQLKNIAQFAGYSGVYVLIDGLDENVATSGQPKEMWSYVAPLLEAPNVLQESGVAFKFFLPDTLAKYMRDNTKGRLDRLASRQLEWNEPQLVSLLGNRLSTLSRISETASIGRVRAFSDLCNAPYDVDLRLVRAAKNRRVASSPLPSVSSSSTATTLTIATRQLRRKRWQPSLIKKMGATCPTRSPSSQRKRLPQLPPYCAIPPRHQQWQRSPHHHSFIALHQRVSWKITCSTLAKITAVHGWATANSTSKGMSSPAWSIFGSNAARLLRSMI
ncbi:hypothetical protein HC928_09090 [bacterium]|nr:hypothetical protein [bacterium]